MDEPAFNHDQAVARTRELLTRADTPAIYEAAFTEDDVRIRVDILARGAGESWDLIEVKSSTSQKVEHIPDVAVQLVTLQRAGVAVDRAAVAHINAYGSHHTDAIVTDDIRAAEEFVAGVDSGCVMVNCSTRFSDGGIFGLGAEIGISTDKLHARGPMGAADLTTYKYIVTGNGQIRS